MVNLAKCGVEQIRIKSIMSDSFPGEKQILPAHSVHPIEFPFWELTAPWSFGQLTLVSWVGGGGRSTCSTAAIGE